MKLNPTIDFHRPTISQELRGHLRQTELNDKLEDKNHFKRWQLFKWIEQSWFPKFLTSYINEHLSFVMQAFGKADKFMAVIEKTLRHTGEKQIVDCSSSSNFLLKGMLDNLTISIPELQLVDPKNKSAQSATGLQTYCLALYNNNADGIRKKVGGAIDTKQPIAIFEISDRRFKHLLLCMLLPILVLLLTPLIGKFKFGKLLFTYIIPVIPIVVLWDSLVSVLRTYTLTELNSFCIEADIYGQYYWQTKKEIKKDGIFCCCIGIPKEKIIF